MGRTGVALSSHLEISIYWKAARQRIQLSLTEKKENTHGSLMILLILTLHYVSFQVCIKNKNTVKQYQHVTADHCYLPVCVL